MGGNTPRGSCREELPFLPSHSSVLPGAASHPIPPHPSAWLSRARLGAPTVHSCSRLLPGLPGGGTICGSKQNGSFPCAPPFCGIQTSPQNAPGGFCAALRTTAEFGRVKATQEAAGREAAGSEWAGCAHSARGAELCPPRSAGQAGSAPNTFSCIFVSVLQNFL